MAKKGDEAGKLIAAADTSAGDVNVGSSGSNSGEGDPSLSLAEILKLYSQPINEEQAWAVCFQCCKALLQGSRTGRPGGAERIEGAASVIIHKDGTVLVQDGQDDAENSRPERQTEAGVIESLGITIYKALDYGLGNNEERELSPPLEQLIDCMTNVVENDGDACRDEGYEATEDEEDEENKESDESVTVRGYKDVIKLCAAHLPSPLDAPSHYQAVCRALYAETKELSTFLEKIKNAKENLRKMEGKTSSEPSKDLNELQNADWARLWVQVMRDLRDGVKLKKVQERQYNPLPFEFQLTPYEMLMDDIRSKRYTLRKVMVNGDIPPKLKKSAHEVILDFIRSRPPLNPVAARKLKPTPPRPRSLHEKILEEIKSERKLRPVSPDEIRRSRFEVSTTEAARRSASPAARETSQPDGGLHAPVVRKRLLKAPTLAELDSSDSEEETSRRSLSHSGASGIAGLSPESPFGKKTPPKFLPVSSTPQPERRQPPQRRHSIEKETPTNVRHFLPPSRQSSKSLEEFCYPVECLALTVEEVMHIRQVLVKAELEKFQQYKDVYNALKKGKLCFCCRTKRFSFFTWSYTCQFCKRPVCSQCCKKMRLPSRPYATLPIYSLGSSALQRQESIPKMERPTASPHRQQSLHKTVTRLASASRLSEKTKNDLELPKELTDDWSAMEVCVDCKKFISEIISSSKRSLLLANKRARLKRKTQSFYMSSATPSEYRPSERTIKEV
ncbi:protein spire homolog 1-like isoform X2 [Erpetoichthys calabaricus]|uniref:protein spire homolog 1-like isoform X2 n=1 Tax=Erpetoichthys calabaricus TaxID=27687 RepID=UPI00109F9B5A|nr:protein spire homolog 1-like isoform X2 [Erpetoichthys calabaricus]